MYVCINVCIYNTYKGLCQPRLSTTNHALLLISPVTTAVYSLERSYAWPPPSLSLLYFLCRGSSCSMLRTFSFSWFLMTSACCLQTDCRYMASGRTPWKKRVTCYQGCVFTAPLPSTGHDADHIKHIRYCCEVFSARCVAMSAARTTENIASLLLAACSLSESSIRSRWINVLFLYGF
jgi:hypothetical protein